MASIINRHIPNTITCLNLLSGAIACVMAFNYNTLIGDFFGYEWAFICIGAATLFDFMDGAVARMLHAYSPMGKELDSLADLISFGLAPAMLMFNTIALSNGSTMSPWAFIALFIVVMGGLRLAHFNVDTRQTTSFIGLPIPSCAIFWIGFIGWMTHPDHILENVVIAYPGNWVTAAIIVAMSLMMVSPLPMFSLKVKNLRLKDNLLRYLIMAAAVAFLIIGGLAGLAWTILLYILLSIAAYKAPSITD